jgi:hypothetical protein
MGRVRRLGISALLVVAVTFLVTGCQPLVLLPGGGGAGTGSCLPGTWNLDTEHIDALATALPGLTITSSGPGVTLTFTDTTWTLHADQTLTGSLVTQYGTASGTVHVIGDAIGTYTSTASTITFTLAGITGSAAYDLTIFGSHVTGTLSLPTSGLQKLYGLSGTATDTCSSSGLTLTFPSFSMHSHH